MNYLRSQRMSRLVIIGVLLVGALAFFRAKQSTPTAYHTITTMEQAATKLQAATPASLVLFDLDGTITSSPDPAARAGSLSTWFKLLLMARFPQLLFRRYADPVLGALLAQSERILIEQSSVELINQLTKQNVPTLALTSGNSGVYPYIGSVPAWRVKTLSRFGITFCEHFADTSFTNLATHHDNHPILHQGILSANHLDKGIVLEAFLDYANITPNHIFFFDDKLSALAQVESACKRRNIPTTLFYYTGADKLPRTWSLSRALTQFKHLVYEHQWISDQELDTKATS